MRKTVGKANILEMNIWTGERDQDWIIHAGEGLYGPCRGIFTEYTMVKKTGHLTVMMNVAKGQRISASPTDSSMKSKIAPLLYKGASKIHINLSETRIKFSLINFTFKKLASVNA